jgi:beta-xylosidase
MGLPLTPSLEERLPVADNPVLPGFHPDPSVCRVGDTYYLACSSFEYLPGIPVFRSTDLVHWQPIGNVIDRRSQLTALDVSSSAGVYAPTLRHHDGEFWLIVTVVGSVGTVIFRAADAAGPWSDPIPAPEVTGIDPDLAWDDDGTCWCTTAGVTQVRLDPATGRTLGPPVRVWSGTPGAKAPEAPHLYHVGDWWYLLLAEGGTERGHAVSVARGPSPQGPFEPCPDNPVLTHRGTDEPVQNTGHADLVQAVDGSWWMVLLGVRPGGGTPGWHGLGRETFLTPVTWEDGWPRPARVTLDIPGLPGGSAGPRSELDDFDSPTLAPRWIAPRRHPGDLGETVTRPGWLTLTATSASLDDPNAAFVGRRQQGRSCRVRARVDASAGRGGLAVRIDEKHHYEVEVAAGTATAIARIGPLRTVLATTPVGEGPVVVRLDIAPADSGWDPRGGPDVITLAVELDSVRYDGTRHDDARQDSDGVVVLARLDGRYLTTEVAGGFTGRVIGPYATAGAVRYDWVELTQ